MKGQAADVCSERQYYGSLEAWKQANLEIARAIVKGRDWDQMICYCDGKELAPRFIHVSWKRNGINRREVRRKMIGGAPIYPKLTAEEMALLMG